MFVQLDNKFIRNGFAAMRGATLVLLPRLIEAWGHSTLISCRYNAMYFIF